MSKYEQIDGLIKKNKGYLFTSDVRNMNISRTYLARYVRDNNLEQVAKGIYVSEDTWVDSLYVIQICNPKIIYSGETALYLNGLLEREYSDICVSVPTGHNGSRLRDNGIKVHQENEKKYGVGVIEVETNYGNIVRVYNKERSICDCIKNRSKYEIQTYQSAVKNYMREKNKSLTVLIEYADLFDVRDEIMKYVEVLV